MNKLPDETLVATIQAFSEHGYNQVKTAKFLGMSRSAFQSRLKRAADRGLDGSIPIKVPEGFIVKTNHISIGKNGEKTGQSITLVHDHGGPFDVPTGHTVQGVSALVDAEGNVRQQWLKTGRSQGITHLEAIAAIESAAANFKPCAPYIMAPGSSLKELALYPLADWHLGMRAHREETGKNWDLSIAKKAIHETFSCLVQRSRKSERAIVLGLGDLVHSDSNENRTRRSGNQLDVDGRYDKVLKTAFELLVNSVNEVAQNHDNVTVRLLYGNHDEHATVAMSYYLAAWFRKSKRITVETSVNPFFYVKYGVNLIGGTHGHEAKPEALPLVMANDCSEDWHGSKNKHFHTGHRHHEVAKEYGGVVVYTHRAPIPTDAYHHANGYRSGQSMRSFSYDFESGRVGTVQEPMR